MKKIIISGLALFILTSSNMSDWATIYCQPDLNKCVQNLNHLELWLEIDHKAGLISDNIYESYKLVAENTSKSIEMVLDPKSCGCDLDINKKPLLDTRGKKPVWK
jgi:hypothetical protein|tara:strand:- start:698 stop:1012 length:315 start_codon:yes stop_codon:yes gene_type:complete